MVLSSCCKSHIGLKRPHNEDNVWVDDELGFYIVCDGMGGGGQGRGAVASQIAVETIFKPIRENRDLLEEYSKSPTAELREKIKTLIREAISLASMKIFELSQNNQDFKGVGTTVAFVLIVDREAFVAHVGDSRAYLIRSGEAHQLTDDHSLIGEYTKSGFSFTPQQTQESRFAHVLTRCVGIHSDVRSDIVVVEIMEGDQFCLCSDGMETWLLKEELVETISFKKELSQIAGELVDLANKESGKDNVSVILIRISGERKSNEETLNEDQPSVDTRLLFLGKISLFVEFSFQELARIMEIIEVFECEENENIVTEGTTGSAMYVVLQGEVQVIREDVEVMATLGPGAFFGEMSLIDAFPRSATVRTSTSSIIMSLSREALFPVIRQNGQMAVKFLWALLLNSNRRLRDNDNELLTLKLRKSSKNPHFFK